MGLGTSLVGGLAGGAAVSIVINAVDNFSKTFGAANAGLLKLGGAMTAVGVAGAVAIGGLTKMAAAYETAHVTFSTMLGSADRATEVLKDLSDFAAKTPFTIPGVREAAKQLVAYGFEVEGLIDNMRMLGDIAGIFSIPMKDMSYLYGTLKAQGRAYTRDMNQFANRGIPIWKEVAKVMGVAETEVRALVEAGEVGFPEIEKAFINMTSEGGIAFKGMEKKAATLEGVISNIQDSFTKLGEVMGQQFLPAAKWVAEGLANIMAWFEEHPKIAKFAAIVLGVTTALSLVIGPILILVALLPAMIAGFGALSLSMLPIIGTIALIAAAIVAIIAIFVWWDEIIVFFTKVFLKAAGIWDRIWEWIKDIFVLGWAIIKNAAASGWNFLVDLYQKGVQKIFSFLTPIFEVINAGSRKLGFGNIIDIKGTQKQIDALSGFKAELTDIGALNKKLAAERESRASEFEAVSNALFEKIKLERLGTDEAEKQLDVVSKETEELKKQQELVSKLQGMKVLGRRDSTTGEWTYGDVFNPRAFVSSDFQSRDAYNQAKGGGGMTINIENINGIDPTEIAEALNETLMEKISI